jgi:hypothetical protein
MPNLTAPNLELDRLIRRTPAGMMHWSGTCSDPAATCSACKHFGFETVQRNDAGNAVGARKYPERCALYKKRTGELGAKFPGSTLACKYFEKKKQP